MDRLQQKCFVASAGVHSLLLVILLVGPAFLAPRNRLDSRPPLDVIPTKVIDAAFSGGGNPHGTPPPPAPPVPPAPPAERSSPPPQPPKEQARQLPPEPVKPDLPDPNALETKTDRKPRLPDVPTKLVRRKDAKKNTDTTSRSSAEDAQAQRIAERNRRIAAALGATARALRDDIAPGTSIEALGPGGGGEVYASYDQVVQSVYWHAWIPPDDTASDAAITKASVTIASDGTVLSAHITKPSGDASVDRSVQRTLERVKFVHEFPEGAKEKQRTYTIKFDLKAKRLS